MWGRTNQNKQFMSWASSSPPRTRPTSQDTCITILVSTSIGSGVSDFTDSATSGVTALGLANGGWDMANAVSG